MTTYTAKISQRDCDHLDFCYFVLNTLAYRAAEFDHSDTGLEGCVLTAAHCLEQVRQHLRDSLEPCEGA